MTHRHWYSKPGRPATPRRGPPPQHATFDPGEDGTDPPRWAPDRPHRRAAGAPTRRNRLTMRPASTAEQAAPHWTLAVDDVAAALRTDPARGLGGTEAAGRRERVGPNELAGQ